MFCSMYGACGIAKICVGQIVPFYLQKILTHSGIEYFETCAGVTQSYLHVPVQYTVSRISKAQDLPHPI